MIADLAATLRQAGLDFTVRELDDIFWLAGLLQAPATPAIRVAQAAATALNAEEQAEESVIESDEPPLVPTTTPVSHERDLPHPIYTFEDNGTVRGGVLRIPGVSGTAAPDQFRRALQPFARRISSLRESRIDEEATADQAADSGIWIPMFRPLRERRFDLSLVVEDCTSSELHSTALSELAHIFRSYSGLRSVTRYWLSGHGKPHLSDSHGAEVRVERLMRSDGRHLVLFASDGTSSRWRDGSAHSFLHALGERTSVSILQLLPESVWGSTAIGRTELALHFTRAGEPNRRAHYMLPWWISREEAAVLMPVPVLSMHPQSAGRWAYAINAHGGAGMPGVMLAPPKPFPAKSDPKSTVTTGPAPGPSERVARYRQMVSLGAYELAVFLSPVDPLTIPVMRVIQRTMAPNSGDSDLAEFLLGGLVQLIPGANAGAPETEKVYRFREGISEQLAKALRISEGEQIREQLGRVGRLLASGSNNAAPFAASFAAPDGTARLSEWALPFAQVSRETLSKFAGAGLPAAVPQLARSRSTLGVLHVCDLRIALASAPVQQQPRLELDDAWHIMLNQLREDSAVDLVCLSGEITATDIAAEYDSASAFLDGTLNRLGLGRDRLFVAPGNNATASNQARVFNEVATAPYRNWQARFLPHLQPRTDGIADDYLVTLNGWTAPVRVVGLDTTWLRAGGATGALTARQEALLDRREPAGLTIALLRHLPRSARGKEEFRRRLGLAQVQLLLCRTRDAGTKLGAQTNHPFVESAPRGLVPSGRAPLEMHLIACDVTHPTSSVVRSLTPVLWSASTNAWQFAPTQGKIARKEPGLPARVVELVDAATPLFGREQELQLLEQMEQMRVPRCIIAGPAGTGKTFLATHFGVHRWRRTDGNAPCIRLCLVDGAEVDAILTGLRTCLGAGEHWREVAADLRDKNALLIIDNVNSAARFKAAKKLLGQLKGCAVMLLVQPWMQFAVAAAGAELAAKTLELAGLPPPSALEVLQAGGPGKHVRVAGLEKVVDALGGNPGALRQVAPFLKQAPETTWLMAILCAEGGYQSIADAIENKTAMEALQRVAFPLFEWRLQAWNHQHGHVDQWLHVPALLAHGPIAGSPLSLGAFLSALPLTTAVDASSPAFSQFCGAAAILGLQHDHATARFSPLMCLWLREREPEQRQLARARFHRWITTQLISKSNWPKLDAAPDTLIDWLRNGGLRLDNQVRDSCREYALRHGPLDEWRRFCGRLLGDPDLVPGERLHWLWIRAQLIHAAHDWEAALYEINIVLAEARAEDRGSGIAYGADSLRSRILTDHPELRIHAGARRQKGKAAQGGKPASARSSPSYARPEPRRHQQHIADVAVEATITAVHGNRRAGIVVQSLGTGMSISLLAFITACQVHPELAHMTQIILVDRRALAEQVATQYRDWYQEREGPDVIVPDSVERLQNALRTFAGCVIVTTIQKFQQLQAQPDRQCLVVYFGLQRIPADYWQTEGAATLIAFSYEASMLALARDQAYGEVIIEYLRRQAVDEGYLAWPKIKSIAMDRSPGPRRSTMPQPLLDEAASRVVAELDGSRSDAPLKAVVVVENVQTAHSLMERLVKASGMEVVVIAVAQSNSPDFYSPVMSSVPRQEQILSFNRSLDDTSVLITTPGMLGGLYLVGVRRCLIFADLPVAARFKVESFVNRVEPQRDSDSGADANANIGEIIDFAHNDWEVLMAYGYR